MVVLFLIEHPTNFTIQKYYHVYRYGRNKVIVNCLNIKQEMFGIVCLHELSSPWGFFTHIETSTWKWGTYGHCDWLFVVLRHFGSISAIAHLWPLSDGDAIHTISMPSPRTRDTRACWQAFDSADVTICFNN